MVFENEANVSCATNRGDGGSSLLLQFISNEEGRLRVFLPASTPQPRVILGNSIDLPDGYKGVFEFFVKDNLQSTRAVLSEETHSENNNCTMEISEKVYEELMFQDGTGLQVADTRTSRNTDPAIVNWLNSGSGAASMGTEASKLNPAYRVGPNLMLKVMAGDQLVLKTDYFYNQPAGRAGSNFAGTVATAIQNLLGGITSQGTGTVKELASTIGTNLPAFGSGLHNFIQNQSGGSSTTPKAYLNYLFFDENFKFVEYDPVTGLGSYAQQVSTSGDGQGIVISNVKAPKNGYVFVYVSNNSNINVYFDNLDVTHIRSHLVEDNAYYPYGLKIKGISARAYDKLKNNYGYQGDYAEQDEETGCDEFDLRMYNPQIGRWNGVDPYDEFASPYVGMGNNPANFIDEDGGGISWGEIGSIFGTLGGVYVAHKIIANNPKMKGGYKKALSVGLPLLGAGIGYSLFESTTNYFSGDDLHGTPQRYKNDDGIQHAGKNGSTNLWANFRQFYVGLIGATSTSEIAKRRVGDKNGYKYATTPDIDLLGWRDNNLPDWDFWKTRGTRDPHVSKIGSLWRSAATLRSSLVILPGMMAGGFVWGVEKWFYPVFRIPVIAWYLYRLIHKGKKGQSPYAYWIGLEDWWGRR